MSSTSIILLPNDRISLSLQLSDQSSCLSTDEQVKKKMVYIPNWVLVIKKRLKTNVYKCILKEWFDTDTIYMELSEEIFFKKFYSY